MLIKKKKKAGDWILFRIWVGAISAVRDLKGYFWPRSIAQKKGLGVILIPVKGGHVWGSWKIIIMNLPLAAGHGKMSLSLFLLISVTLPYKRK
jgi:hypothetical protein